MAQLTDYNSTYFDNLYRDFANSYQKEVEKMETYVYRVVLEKPDFDRVIILDESLSEGIAHVRAQLIADTFYHNLSGRGGWTVKVEKPIDVPRNFETCWTPTPRSKQW